jgi:hypothetical protein
VRAPKIDLDVHPATCIDARAFPSWDALAEYIVQLDDNPERVRPFFEPQEPVLIDLDQTRNAIVALFEQAEQESGTASRFRRGVRPWLLEALQATRRLRANLRIRTPFKRLTNL